MRHQLVVSAAAAAFCVFGTWGTARSEVYAEFDASGKSSVHITPSGRGGVGGVWGSMGAAATGRLVLNPNGDLQGDGQPDVSVNPVTGIPLAVWSSGTAANREIVASTFDGTSWSRPIPIHPLTRGVELDPKIAFTPGGIAVVAWWVTGRSPVVRLAFNLPNESSWIDGGVLTELGQRASHPSILQQGPLTIIAYRTPEGSGVQTLSISAPTPLMSTSSQTPSFGDGPTPFPRSGHHHHEAPPGPTAPPLPEN